MFFQKFEDKILKTYKTKLDNDNSLNNILKVFTDTYMLSNKKFDRNNDADMLLFQYGVYDWGNGKNLEIDFVRQLIQNDDVIQIHITLKIPYQDEFSKIESFNEWYNSSHYEMSLTEWHDKIKSSSVFQTIEKMNYELEIWKENAE